MQRLLSRQEAAKYCGLSPSGFDNWIREGRMPPPLPGTKRWDKNAIDQRLDKMSGFTLKADNDSPLDDWLEKKYAC